MTLQLPETAWQNVARLAAVDASDDVAALTRGERAFRVEFDLYSGNVHAVTELPGRPFLTNHVLEYGPRHVVEFYAHDEEDARRTVARQRAKHLNCEAGVTQARQSERLPRQEACDLCMHIGQHAPICPRATRG